MAGASMKDIKLRIKSVESTMQITKAMGTCRFLQAQEGERTSGKMSPLFHGAQANAGKHRNGDE